jgi:hypothetical protein
VPAQRDQFAQQRPIRQKPLKVGKVERPDPQHDSRLLVPGAHACSRIEAQLAERPRGNAHRQPRALVKRQGHPGAGKLLDFDRPSQPVGGQGFQPIGRARMGRKEASVMA